jgi:hypothetical protein
MVKAEDAQAEGFAAGEVATGLRAGFVKGAELGYRIEADAGAVAALVHAEDALALDGEMVGDRITGAEFHDEMTTASATGAQREIEDGGNDGSTCKWRGVSDTFGKMPSFPWR